jgi:hypothetical protein
METDRSYGLIEADHEKNTDSSANVVTSSAHVITSNANNSGTYAAWKPPCLLDP